MQVLRRARGKRMSIRDTLTLTIGGLALLIAFLVGVRMASSWSRLRSLQELTASARLSDHLFVAIDELGAERNVATSLLVVRDQRTRAHLRGVLLQRRALAEDASVLALGRARAYGEGVAAASAALARIDAKLALVDATRVEIDRVGRAADPLLGERWFEVVTELIEEMEQLWIELDREVDPRDPAVALHGRSKVLMRVVQEHVGRQTALVGRLVARASAPTPEELADLLQWHATVQTGFELCRALAELGGLSETVQSEIEEASSHYATLHDMVSGAFYLPESEAGEDYPIGPEFWLELSTQVDDSLLALREVSLREMAVHRQALEADARAEIFTGALLALIAVALCGGSFRIITTRVVRPIDAMVDALVRTSCDVSGSSKADGADEIARLERVLSVFRRSAEAIEAQARELEEYAGALERSNQELDDFAYIASHDLKEPLRGIHNHARFLLEDNAGRLDPDSERRLGRLIYLSKRMERLVNDLLYFSRLGRQDLAVRSTDLNAVVRDVEQTLEALLDERKTRLRVAGVLPEVVCDKTRVTELIRNLVQNAARYSDPSKPESWVEIGAIRRHASPDGVRHDLVLYARDNGIGILPEFHEEIFRIFKRLKALPEGPETPAGTGVGLTFVKKIVERHGGQIWLESLPGEGTTFYFTLEGETHGAS